MAKLLKHLGFGSKKNPPHPPQRDYVGKQNAEIDGAFEDEDFQGGVVINDDGAEKSSPDQVGGQRLGSPPTRADGRIQVLPLPERTTSARSPSSTAGGSQPGSRINQLLTEERQTNPGAASGGMEPDDIVSCVLIIYLVGITLTAITRDEMGQNILVRVHAGPGNSHDRGVWLNVK